jgi:hypothetical protein
LYQYNIATAGGPRGLLRAGSVAVLAFNSDVVDVLGTYIRTLRVSDMTG